MFSFKKGGEKKFEGEMPQSFNQKKKKKGT